MDLTSQCALRAERIVWRPGHGGFTFTVVCKATFELRPDLSPLAHVQEPVTIADVYAGEAGALVLTSDLVPFKKRPEVLVIGHAHAPEGRPVRSLAARIATGEIDKTLQVFGDHHFTMDDVLVEPERFTRMPVVWGRAAGGPGTSNPAGIPTGAAAVPDAFGRVRAPNVLPTGLLLTSRHDVVPPAGFGPIAPRWPSRALFLHRHGAGWDPARWHERPLPSDIDVAYFNAAPLDQQRTLPFAEETIYLENLHPRFARLSTRLVPVVPVATADQGSGPQPLQMRCDTLLIDTDRGVAMLVWRGHVPLDHPDRPGRVIIGAPTAHGVRVRTWTHDVSDESATMAPGLVAVPSNALPFSGSAPATNWLEARRRADTHVITDQVITDQAITDRGFDDEACMTLAPGFVPHTPVLPFAVARDGKDTLTPGLAPPLASFPFVSSPRDAAPLLEPAPAEGSSHPSDPSWASDRVRATVDLVPEPSRPPAPPPLLEAIVIAAEEADDRRITQRPPAAEKTAASDAVIIQGEPEIDFDAYPPERCGSIAARLACDGDGAAQVLSAEGLDAARWKRVHERRLDELRAEAGRSRKKALSDYDAAYVRALEAHRGAITLAEYARLAEAGERGAAAEALAAARMPAGAWPHIHRVWIRRTAKDMKLGKQVRAAIEQARAGD